MRPGMQSVQIPSLYKRAITVKCIFHHNLIQHSDLQYGDYHCDLIH